MGTAPCFFAIFTKGSNFCDLLFASWRKKPIQMGSIPISLVIRHFFSFQNNPKNLDLAYKTDLDLWDCLGRVKLVLQQTFIGLIQLFLVILERGKPCLIAK